MVQWSNILPRRCVSMRTAAPRKQTRHRNRPMTRHRMTPEYYDQMLAEINAAGGDKIQAELQRQLDEWLAENPDWNK